MKELNLTGWHWVIESVFRYDNYDCACLAADHMSLPTIADLSVSDRTTNRAALEESLYQTNGIQRLSLGVTRTPSTIENVNGRMITWNVGSYFWEEHNGNVWARTRLNELVGTIQIDG
jgi:hypothetical protein